MNRIQHVVARARRRVIAGRLGRSLAITVFVALIVAVIAIAVPSLVSIGDLDPQIWNMAWIAGSLGVAVVASLIYALVGAPTADQTAAEVDRRFQLRQRLSSSLALPSADRDTDFGRALVADADARAADLSIAEKFELRLQRIAWLPIVMVPVLIVVMLIAQPMSSQQAEIDAAADPVEVRQVKAVAKDLKKRIAEQKQKAEEKGLTEAKELFEKMEADLDKLAARKDLGRKEAMIEMNDLKKQLDERRQQLGSSREMRKMMSQLDGIGAGPGEKIAEQIQKGDFGKAEETVRQLAEKIKKGELSEQEKQQLQKQAEQMADAINKAITKHDQKKKELQRQIDKAKQQGKGQEADKLQQQMNEMSQKDQQMQDMQKMADAMQDAAGKMQQGDASAAAEAMEGMADQLGKMQSEMEELQDLESALGDLAQGKQQMRCQSCGGGGCKQCQGRGGAQGDKPGQGMGRGNGEGERPETEGETNTYETQVRGQVKKGRAIIAGYADGPNRKGATREAIKEAVESAMQEQADPAENQVLPRTEREHAREYFDRLRDGSK